MASTLEILEKSTAKLEITVSAEEFQSALEAAYHRTRGRYVVQGFRKGRAPRNLIERYYGDDVFFEAAVEELWSLAYADAIKEYNLEVVSRPQITVTQAEVGKPLLFDAVVSTYPKVTLGTYKGIEIERQTPRVLDEQVQRVIDDEGAKAIRYIEVERPVEAGDRIIFDYKGRVSEEYFSGGEAQNAQLDIGSNQFIPGFEDAMIGVPKGESREIHVTFPQEYHAEDLAGKESVFEVLVHTIREPEYPVLDDEFAKDVSEFDTIEEWKKDIRDKMLVDATNAANAAMQNAILESIVDLSIFTVPDVMVEAQIDRMLQNMDYRLQESGINLEMYLQYTGMPIEDLREQYRVESTKRVNNQVVLDEITKIEGFVATEEELDAKLLEYATAIQASLEEYKATLTEDDRRYFMEDIAMDKTLNFLLENAVLVDKKEQSPDDPSLPDRPVVLEEDDVLESMENVLIEDVEDELDNDSTEDASKI